MASPERSSASLAFKGGRLDDAISECERAIALSHAQAENDECWSFRILLSQCLCQKGEFAKSIAVLEVAPIGEAISAKTRASLLNQRGICLSRAGNFTAAKEALDEAKRLAEDAASPALVAEIEVSRSTLFFFLAKYDKVEECACTALRIGEELTLPMVQASACAGMGKSHMYRERQTEAIQWFERALAIYKREGASFYADIMRSELGCCHFALQQYDSAKCYFAEALRASRASGALAGLHIDLANMGCLHLCLGEFAAAISHFQEALKIARSIDDAISVSKWLWNLELAYTWMGNPALAENYQVEAKRVEQKVARARAAAM